MTLLGGMLRQLDKEMQTRRFESKITILNKVMGAEGHKITQQYIPRLVVNVGVVFPSVLRSVLFYEYKPVVGMYKTSTCVILLASQENRRTTVSGEEDVDAADLRQSFHDDDLGQQSLPEDTAGAWFVSLLCVAYRSR